MYLKPVPPCDEQRSGYKADLRMSFSGKHVIACVLLYLSLVVASKPGIAAHGARGTNRKPDRGCDGVQRIVFELSGELLEHDQVTPAAKQARFIDLQFQ